MAINQPETTKQDDLQKLIARLNADDTIHGILVPLPLPKHLDEAAALAVIAPEKDVDGFHLLNAGRMMSGQPGVVACTPMGAMEMIRRTGIDLGGKEAVVVGRSNIVGKPLAMLGGRPVIQRVYEQVAGVLDDAVVATDDERIYDTVLAFGGRPR